MKIRFILLAFLIFVFAGCDSTSDNLQDTDGDIDNEIIEAETQETSDGDEEQQEEASDWLDIVVTGFEDFSPKLCYLEEEEDRLGFDASYTLLKNVEPLQYKNFYLLTIFDEVQEIKNILTSNSGLNAITEKKLQDLKTANDSCENKECFYEAVSLSADELQNVQTILAEILLEDSMMTAALAAHVRPSGAFALHVGLSDTEMLAIIVDEQFAALNKDLNKYGSDLELTAFQNLFDKLENDIALDETFYKPMLAATVSIMLAVSRDESGRYEPMEDGENQAAIEQMDEINWNDYPFTVILVPGLGPNSSDVALAPGGAGHCDLAVERFNAKLAPLIVVSGGHVHPDKTPYCEAIEMKKYLIDTYGVDESRILVDPHARHTTTNLRNVARLLYRYGIPTDRPYMTTTNMFQSAGISILDGRCLDELYYVPYRKVKVMSNSDNCTMPSINSLYIDPRDPLDP